MFFKLLFLFVLLITPQISNAETKSIPPSINLDIPKDKQLNDAIYKLVYSKNGNGASLLMELVASLPEEAQVETLKKWYLISALADNGYAERLVKIIRKLDDNQITEILSQEDIFRYIAEKKEHYSLFKIIEGLTIDQQQKILSTRGAASSIATLYERMDPSHVGAVLELITPMTQEGQAAVLSSQNTIAYLMFDQNSENCEPLTKMLNKLAKNLQVSALSSANTFPVVGGNRCKSYLKSAINSLKTFSSKDQARVLKGTNNVGDLADNGYGSEVLKILSSMPIKEQKEVLKSFGAAEGMTKAGFGDQVQKILLEK